MGDNTDIDFDALFESTAASNEPAIQPPGRIERLENWFFGLIKGKRVAKTIEKAKEDTHAESDTIIDREPEQEPVHNNGPEPCSIPSEDPPMVDDYLPPVDRPDESLDELYTIVSQMVDDRLLSEYPPAPEPSVIQITISKMVLPVSLVIFALGAFTIYSEIPTHPNLVFGIILVCVASCSILREKK